MSRVPYSSAVGSIIYAMVYTRLDISQTVSMVSCYIKRPGKTHWEAVKWILRYLNGITDVGIVYRRDSNGSETTGFVDSDHANDLDDRRSLARYEFMLTSGAVSWKASLQDHITLSSTEVKYMALTFVAKETIWLQSLLLDFVLELEKCRYTL